MLAVMESVRGMSTPLVESSGSLVKQGSVRTFARRAWMAVSAVTAAVLGLLPHILHHVGPLAGAALFAGVGGSLLFAAIGFFAAIPFLRRVHRHCGNWRVPAGILAAMAAVFSLSTFVLAPAITGGGEDKNSSAPSESTPGPATPSGHEGHH